MSFSYGNWVRAKSATAGTSSPAMVMKQVGHMVFLAGGGIIHEDDAIIVRYRDYDKYDEQDIDAVYKAVFGVLPVLVAYKEASK
jgi:hypothetical protein